MQPDTFREIHKNSWLKSRFRKGGERWWVVFCVHGDVDPFLEGYSDPASATAHTPRWRVSLKRALHVSGSVGPPLASESECEFVVASDDPETSVRLSAPTWESMRDWVDTLRNKLREMKIVAAEENLYSKGPEHSKPRAPTRDPTSPLPPPPPGPVIRVPGTEPANPSSDPSSARPQPSVRSAFTFNRNDIVTSEMTDVVASSETSCSTPTVQNTIAQNTVENETTLDSLSQESHSSNNRNENVECDPTTSEYVNTSISNTSNVTIITLQNDSNIESIVEPITTNAIKPLQISVPSPPPDVTEPVTGTEISVNETVSSDDASVSVTSTTVNYSRVKPNRQATVHLNNQMSEPPTSTMIPVVNNHSSADTSVLVNHNSVALNNSIGDSVNRTIIETERFETTSSSDDFSRACEENLNSFVEPSVSDVSVNNVSICEIKNSNGQSVIGEEDFYECLFAPLPPKSGAVESSQSTSSVFNRLKKEISRRENMEYEFLSWNNNALRQNKQSASKITPQTNERSPDSPSLRIVNEPISNGSSSNNTETFSHWQNTDRPLNLSSLQPVKPSSSDTKPNKPNLFTRGLTELSFMTRFKSSNSQESSRHPLLKNSQFYSYEEVDPLQVASTSGTNGTLEQFGGLKLDSLCNLSNDNKLGNATAGGRSNGLVTQNKTSEPLLKRNWSEHNDRIVLPIVKKITAKNTNNQSTSAENTAVSLRQSEAREDQTRRRSNSLSEKKTPAATSSQNASSSKNPDALPNGGESPGTIIPQISLRPMSLREQQVARLRGEMAHTGGVRLRLRSSDCPSEAMALADVYGTVWICGWKQKTHPMLYNALHIGDRLVTVGGVLVTSVRQAKKVLKDTAAGLHYVELVIRRLPHGRVYTIKKDSDSQDLGLVMDGATVVGIVSGSPASKCGISPHGTLTEINGRPLNLLSKKGDSQVQDRLNAIGRDVSILMQPKEFVTLLRTGLRNTRGHKDYIIQ